MSFGHAPSSSRSAATPKVESPLQAGAPSRPPSSADSEATGFHERRRADTRRGVGERRQFGNSHAGLSPEARELALAIDRYKFASRRRYITCDELLAVITELGYRRADPASP